MSLPVVRRRRGGWFASLTSRLVLTAVALVAVVSLLIGTATTLAMRSYLTGRLDDQVRDAMSRSFGGPPPSDGGSPSLGTAVGTVTAGFPSDGSTPGGWHIVTGSNGYPHKRVLSDSVLDRLDDVPADGRVHRVDLTGLGSYRAIAQTVSDGTIVVALPSSDVDDTLSNLVLLELLLGLCGVLAAAAGGLFVVRRQLRPLREVAATAHHVASLPLARGEIELAERVPEPLTDERTEVGQVGAALNTLLAHVESSLTARHESEQQVRQFVADASHELRSPLTTIAGYTELARRRPDDLATVRAALDKVEEESGRMTTLVEDLLLLARLDAGRPLSREPVDLTRLLVEAVSDARVVAPDHQWRLDLPPTSVEVAGDPARLHQVVSNLLTNARKYTPAGTTVTVSADATGFAVHDDGPGFPPDLVAHAFERFARGDAARTRGAGSGDQSGVGLGLALVRAIVTAHGGRVALASTPGSTTVSVALPA